jgi:phosphoribosylaminoimidazolecarboxamide formyltransferase / IMP cyclohydrolase
MKVWIQISDITGLETLAKDLNILGASLYAEGKALSVLESANIPVHKGSTFSWKECDFLVANLYGTACPLVWDREHDHDDTVCSILHQASHQASKVVLSSPAQYIALIEELKSGSLSEDTRREFRVQAVRHLSWYHSRLDEHLSRDLLQQQVVHLEFQNGTSLRYGENSHQGATFYKEEGNSESSLANAIQLHGKELSYNNIVDADAALEMVREFADKHAVVVVKHLNPAGLATGDTLEEAFEAAWEGDPVSAFGSVIACSSKVDLATAKRLQGRFVEIILAPGFDEDALEFLIKKSKQIRILEIRNVKKALPGKVLKHVIGGLLIQDRDVETFAKWEVVTKTPFPKEKLALAEFTWIVTKHTKSNAIVMCHEYKDGCYQILGLGPGQPNRIDSNQRLCQPRVKDNVARMELAEGQFIEELEASVFQNLVMGSDAFFPFSDSVEASAEAGIRFIVQPGGSMRDQEVIDKADELGVAMIFTSTRHFRH